jgi:ArsR family transcriptional regulator
MHQPVHQYKAEFFKALGHPVRLAILDHLRKGEMSVGELQAALGLDQSAMSQQLSVLRNRDIVIVRKAGTTSYYSVPDKTLFALLDTAREIFNHRLVGTQKMLKSL